MRTRRYVSTDEQLEFYRGAKHSPELQHRLDLMKGWNAKRLAVAVPAWAKPNLMPAPFRPQLEQHLPNFLTRFEAPHPAQWFYNMPSDVRAYVKRWDADRGYKPVKYLVRYCEPMREAA